MEMCRKRNTTIDAIRGIGIVLVVIGHIIQILNPVQFDTNIIFKLIYSFHMPLFMLISGLSFYISQNKTEKTGVKIFRRGIKLALPFFIWTLIHCLLKGNTTLNSITDYFYTAIVRPDIELWFLWILFLNTIFLAAIIKISSFFQLNISRL